MPICQRSGKCGVNPVLIRSGVFHAPSVCLACQCFYCASAPSDNLIHIAQDVADHLADSQYQHKGMGGQPDISQGADGLYSAYTDCSGFVTWVLDRLAPTAMTPITDEMRRPRERHKWPRAYVFQRHFDKIGTGHDQYWQGITTCAS